MTKKISNFGRNVEYTPAEVYQPESPDDVLDILNKHRGEEIRAVGKLHSWSQAIKTTGVLIDMRLLKSIDIERDERTTLVDVEAGCQIKRLVRELAKEDLTLPSLGLIDEQTVAGATATGTHGSGKNSLSHYIESVSIAHYGPRTGRARITTIRSGQDLKAARCSLGLMGIVVSLKLRCRPRYRLEELTRMHDSLTSVLALENEYPQQQFYLFPWTWKYLGHHRVETEAQRSWLAPLYQAYWFGMIDVGLHLIMIFLARVLRSGWAQRFFYRWIVNLTVIRNIRVVDDSSSILTMQHELFRHIEIEIFVQRAQLESTINYLKDVISRFGGVNRRPLPSTRTSLEQLGRWEEFTQYRGKYTHHYPICVRRIRSDATLISMCSPGDPVNEDWYAISLISFQRPKDRKGFFDFANFVAETCSRLFQARCHWGKYHSLDRETIESLYPKLDQFRESVKRHDPDGVFCNDWLRELI